MRTLLCSLFLLVTVGLSAQSWSYVGSCCIESGVDALSSAGSEDLDFLSDATPVVSFFRQTGGSTTGKVMQYTGGSWNQVGSDLPAGGTISYIDLEVFEDEIYVAMVTGATQLCVYHFDGAAWSQLGDCITGNMAHEFIIDNNGTPYVFNTLNQTIYAFDGTEWVAEITLTETVSPSWTGDESIVINADNEMYYIQSVLNMVTFTFENYIHVFNGTTITPLPEVFFTGLGTGGKLAFNNTGQLHAQYVSNNTNKIVQYTGSGWEHVLDTLNATNGLFQFKYAFDGSNKLILSVFANVYYANDFSGLPALPASGLPIAINNIALGPDNAIYVSLGEIPTGEGSNFSVMKWNQLVDVQDIYADNMNLYPNPANSVVTISQTQLSSGPVDVQITDLSGRIVYATTFQDLSQQISVSDFAEGVYVVRYAFASGASGNMRFVVVR